MDTLTVFGPWLKQRRKALDLTQAELAGVVGCAMMTIQKIEAEERRPSKQLAGPPRPCPPVPPADHATFVRIARGELPPSSSAIRSTSRPRPRRARHLPGCPTLPCRPRR